MKSVVRALAVSFLLFVVSPSGIGQTDTLQKYITDDFVVGFAARPARLLKSKYVTMLIDAADKDGQFEEQMLEAKQGIGLDPRETDELIMLLDKRTIFEMAGLPQEAADEAGDVATKPKAVMSDQQQKTNLRKLALGFHNFHDVYRHFSDEDGHEDGNKGNLSWRVHLLPYYDYAPLYNQFHLDEPWDSEHNKTLIPKMPDVFLTNGVDDATKTSVHVFSSKGTMFGGDKSPRIRDILDGTSNTIMTIVAGADKAEVWTKPGGLELKDGAPENSLGNIGDRFAIGLADGSVRFLEADCDAKTFQALVTHQGGETINAPDADSTGTRSRGRLPSWIVHSTTDINKAAVFAAIKPMGDPVKVQNSGGSVYTLGDYAISFANSRTLVAAPAEILPKMLEATGQAQSTLTKKLNEAGDSSDFTLVADLKPLTTLKNHLAGNIPMAGVIQTMDVVCASCDVSGTSDYLQNVTAKMQTETAARQLSGLAMGMLQVQKVQMMTLANDPNSPFDAGMMKTMMAVFDKAEVKADGKTVLYAIPKPDDMNAFAEELKPAVVQLFGAVTQARAAARRAQGQNRLKRIGLAFHNYHDVYRAFPRHGSDADDRSKGLSWRVQLLPFIDQADLYNRFKRDEPWDSEHNKKLIGEMPDSYKVEGVEKPGHTCIHVFVGDHTPFGDGTEKTRIRDITDGTSNTFLAVQAGAGTADVWTKPGGLEFTGEGGIKVLGNIGETFHALFCDGSVRPIPANIDEGTLDKLIQHSDGNAVPAF